jgi:serralysin
MLVPTGSESVNAATRNLRTDEAMVNGYWQNKQSGARTWGDDARYDGALARQGIAGTNATGDRLVDGVLAGLAWRGGRITYSFPDNSNDYQYGPQKKNDFGEVDASIKTAARFILDKAAGNSANDGFSVEGFTGLSVGPGSDGKATLRYAESSSADPTAYAYYPSQSARGGDVWFGAKAKYDNAVAGNYDFATVIHETGHALGLKHGHQAENGFPKLPHGYDSLEYSVMTYKSFVGDDAQFYKNEFWGFPQTYMMSDIAALQHLYGANYNVNSGDTTYSWKPGSGNTFVNGKVAIDPGANRIFATIWDGGGSHDTYDLSAYSSNLSIDLRPGGHSLFKSSQLADLGDYEKPGRELARGNIFNALLHEDDTRSLIEDAIGGRGKDIIIGNSAANALYGKAGNDTLWGWSGDDLLEGGGGKDIFVFRARWGNDTVIDFRADDKINLSSFGFDGAADVLALATDDDGDVLITFATGDTLRIDNRVTADLVPSDFIL